MVNVTCFGLTTIWFHGNKPFDHELNGELYPRKSHARYKSIRTARRIARGIIARWPDQEVWITRYSVHGGKGSIKSELWSRRAHGTNTAKVNFE